MSNDPYKLTDCDKETIGALVLELATELDLHYDDEDLHVLAPTFAVVKDAVSLLQRCNGPLDAHVLSIVARFNRSRQ